MQFQPQGKPPVGIVFDADLGNTIDDALALAMLFGFQGKNESRVLSVSTTKSSLQAAIFADVLVRFYTGEPGPFAGAMPIGLALSGKMAAPNADARGRDRQSKISAQYRQDERYGRSAGADPQCALGAVRSKRDRRTHAAPPPIWRACWRCRATRR